MAKRCIGESTIRKRADGRWMTQLTIKLTDGRSKRITIINRDKDIVKTKLLEVQQQQQKRILFSSKNWLVRDYLDYWLKQVAVYKIRTTTWESYEVSIRLYIKPALGRKKLNELGVRDVTKALDELERKGVPGRVRQRFKQVLSSCLSHAVREEVVFRNVAMLAKMPKVSSAPTIPWSAEQAAYFLEKTKNEKYFVAFLIMITYGLRVGEMLGLRWSDIDFENNVFIVRQQIVRTMGKLVIQTVKTDSSRRQLPLVPAVKEALLNHAVKNAVKPHLFAPQRELSAEGLVITTSLGTPLEAGLFRRRHFQRLITKYRMPPIKLHGLRHTAATILKDMGVPVKDVQEILGHTDISTTLKVYQHGSNHVKWNALTRMGDGLTASYRYSCSQKLQSNCEFHDEISSPPLPKIEFLHQRPQAYESHPCYTQELATPVVIIPERQRICTKST